MSKFIIAAPGSGKTNEIVRHIESYISKNDKKVVAICFTREAAKELDTRVNDICSKENVNSTAAVTCSTIHSLAFKLLRNYELPKAKLELKLEKQVEGRDQDENDIPEDLFYTSILEEATKELLTGGYVGDLGLLAIDEAQDLSYHQWNFVAALMRFAENVIIVGDPLQSIFKYQGSDPKYMFMLAESLGLNIERQVNNITHRFGNEIADFINEVFILDNPIRSLKSGSSVSIEEISTKNQHSWITSNLDDNITGILFRTNREISEFIRKVENKDKYNYILEMSSHPLVSTAALVACADYNIDPSLILNCSRFLGYNGFEMNRAVLMLQEIASTGQLLNVPFLKALFRKGSQAKSMVDSKIVITPRISSTFRHFIESVEELMVNNCDSINDKIHKVLDNLQEVGYSMEKIFSVPNTIVYEAVINRVLKNRETLYKVDNGERVTAMTMHSSKGREFDNVIAVVNPWMNLSSDDERRLLYVAFTRARNNLKVLLPDRDQVKTTKERNILDSILAYKGII